MWVIAHESAYCNFPGRRHYCLRSDTLVAHVAAPKLDILFNAEFCIWAVAVYLFVLGCDPKGTCSLYNFDFNVIFWSFRALDFPWFLFSCLFVIVPTHSLMSDNARFYRDRIRFETVMCSDTQICLRIHDQSQVFFKILFPGWDTEID